MASRDGKRIAYVVSDSARWQVVVDGVAGRAYDEILDFPSMGEMTVGGFTFLARRGAEDLRVSVDRPK